MTAQQNQLDALVIIETGRPGSAPRRFTCYRISMPRAAGARSLPPLIVGAASLGQPQGPSRRTPPRPPNRWLRPTLASRAAAAVRRALDNLLHAHQQSSALFAALPGPLEERLVCLNWIIPFANASAALEADLARLPLRAVWEAWWGGRPAAQRDRDGLEVIRALMIGRLLDQRRAAGADPWQALNGRRARAARPSDIRYPVAVERLLEWLMRLFPPPGAADCLLDAAEFALSRVPPEALTYQPSPLHAYHLDWRHTGQGRVLLDLARRHRALCPQDWAPRHHARLWRLARWIDEPSPGFPRCRPTLADTILALQAGAATEADLLDQFAGPQIAQPGRILQWRTWRGGPFPDGQALAAE